jgi:acyl-[acyl-carrier-protein]-phospholipid O-acyltransferase/long-chain-fatty-acid--[acyl-carrier-protein] ligase
VAAIPPVSEFAVIHPRLSVPLLASLEPWAYALAGLALLVLLFGLMMRRRPELIARVFLGWPTRLLYRIRVHGAENVPATGAALLVCNHVSFIDAFLIFLAQRRPVRFIIWAAFLRVPGLRHLLRWSRVIPIDGTAGPRAILQSLRAASEALQRGEVVCIFAEGGITRTGLLLPFQRGFEQIVKKSPAPIIPVCLDHVWGSIFSFHGGRFFWKWPQKLPYPVSIAFGSPLPHTATAFEVRQAIQLLSAQSAMARRDQQRPVHRQFIRMAARHPFRNCFIDPNQNGRSIRYVEVLAAAHILSQKLKPIVGDAPMVGVWLPPSYGGAVTNIALALMGKTAVNLNYTASPSVVNSAARQCNLRHVLTSRLFSSKVKLELEPGIDTVNLEDFRKEVTRWHRTKAALQIILLPRCLLERWIYHTHKHSLDDLATVIFSSGSTGDPKGVMLTHGNLVANAESVIQAIDPGPSDRVLGVLPFFHSFGYTVTLWVPLQVGASAVYYPDPRQAKEIGELCRQHRCTIFLTTPTFLRFCLRRCENADLASLRILMCGAEKLQHSLAEEVQAKFGVMPLEGYGCTELSPVATVNVPDWELGATRQIGNKPGTIGQPVPGVAVRVIDSEHFDPNDASTFAPLPVCREGLLLVKGGNVMQGYLGRPEATRAVVCDGWYVTGDIGKIDEDGFITLTDRLSRFSKIGGEMVPHQRIEDELHVILGTSERLCVVTGVPDEKRGERLVVLHTPLSSLTVTQLSEQLGTRGLPNLWIPSERDFFELPELPILGSGKLDLKKVKELAVERGVSKKAPA